MRVLVFKNYPCEDAAVAGEAFERLGHELRVIDCYNGDPAPGFADGDAALVLGGPMNVYEEDKYPFLKWETDWMRRWVEADRPLLGLCLGAQLLSKAAGGTVTKNRVKEIGHFDVELTPEGRRDPVFQGFPAILPVVQWHGDTFTIPEGGVNLARSPLCENQAVRIRRAVGLQFHLEIGRAKMSEWMSEYDDELPQANATPAEILDTFAAREALYTETCHRLVENFCRGIGTHGLEHGRQDH